MEQYITQFNTQQQPYYLTARLFCAVELEILKCTVKEDFTKLKRHAAMLLP